METLKRNTDKSAFGSRSHWQQGASDPQTLSFGRVGAEPHKPEKSRKPQQPVA